MSQSPSKQRDTASASPESSIEGDFLPQQIYDNLKSLEEQETCADQKDPIVNSTHPTTTPALLMCSASNK